MKNKSTIILIAVLAIIGLLGIGQYNRMVTARENVEMAWGDVQSQYQRRADLVPNLVSTVKGYAAHEANTLEAVIAARSKATQITLDPSKATPAQIEAYQKAQGELGQALGKLLAVTEAYPDLKANENFLQLQSQLEGTENRITVARNRFNEKARDYNRAIVTFPGNIIASFFGFEKTAYFEADPDAKSAPKVSFE